LFQRPVGELRGRAAELAFQASDVGAVAVALESLQHQRHILAVLLDLFDWRLCERNRPTQRLRQDLRRLRHRLYVIGEIDFATVQGNGVGERARPNQPMSSTAIICSLMPCPSAQASVEPWRLKGASRFSMKNTGRRTQDHMRGEAEAAHGFLDVPLIVEVRDARPLVCRSHGCVDLVLGAGLARQCRKTLALRLFPLDTRLPRLLHAEDAPRAKHGAASPRRRDRS
jgi:hypothetical protein